MYAKRKRYLFRYHAVHTQQSGLNTAMSKPCRHRCMGSAESTVHECVLFVGSSLLVFKQVEAAAWTWSALCLGTHEFLEATQKPGSILDDDGQASGLNKLINHECIALVPSDLQRVFAPCVRIAQLLLGLTRYATVDLNDKVHQQDIVRPDFALKCQCRYLPGRASSPGICCKSNAQHRGRHTCKAVLSNTQ